MVLTLCEHLRQPPDGRAHGGPGGGSPATAWSAAAASPSDVHPAGTTEAAPSPRCGPGPATDGRGGGGACTARRRADTNSAAHDVRHLAPSDPATPRHCRPGAPAQPEPRAPRDLLPTRTVRPALPPHRPTRHSGPGWDTQVPLRVRPDLRDDPADGDPSAEQAAAGPPAGAPLAPAPRPNPSPSRTWVPGTTSTSADSCDLVASRNVVRPPSARAKARPLDAFNAGDQRLATLREPHGPILSRVRCIAWLEHRSQHGQANACFNSHSGKVRPCPAAIHDIRHDAGQRGRTPSRSNNGEDLRRLGDQASDSKAQKKSAVGGAELGDPQRLIRLNTKNTAHGFRE